MTHDPLQTSHEHTGLLGLSWPLFGAELRVKSWSVWSAPTGLCCCLLLWSCGARGWTPERTLLYSSIHVVQHMVWIGWFVFFVCVIICQSYCINAFLKRMNQICHLVPLLLSLNYCRSCKYSYFHFCTKWFYRWRWWVSHITNNKAGKSL